jgi:hypothetical protein
MNTLLCIASSLILSAALEASELRRFEPPLIVDAASLTTIASGHPWVRACCSEWMSWAFTFEEWKSYRSQTLIHAQKIDPAKFESHQQATAAHVPREKSILATLPLSQDGADFLIVISCAGKLDRYPEQKRDLTSGFQKILLRKTVEGWRLVDLGTDLPYESPVAKKMLSIDASALEIPKEKKKEPNQSPEPTAPSGRGSA